MSKSLGRRYRDEEGRDLYERTGETPNLGSTFRFLLTAWRFASRAEVMIFDVGVENDVVANMLPLVSAAQSALHDMLCENEEFLRSLDQKEIRSRFGRLDEELASLDEAREEGICMRWEYPTELDKRARAREEAAEGLHVCPECGYEASSEGSLALHLNLH